MPSKKIDHKKNIIATYTKLAARRRGHPTRSAMVNAGISWDRIRHHFGSFAKLHEAAKAASPEVFEVLNEANLYSPDRLKQIKEAIDGCTKFVVTTAVTGQKVHKPFLESLRNYCKIHGAKLLILTSTDPASNRDEKPFDEELEKEHIIGQDVALNKNLFISSIKLSAKHIDPITGLGRIGQRNGSFIYASPKQRLKIIATSNTELPGAIMTTGAITIAQYDPNPDWPHAYMSKRTAYIAEHDHVMGAIIVELDGKSQFHFRQIQADKAGRFADLGKLYSPTDVEDYAPAALILGDLHTGESDMDVLNAFIFNNDSLCAVTKPRYVFIHDGFDGCSINHHEEKNITIRARLAAVNRLSLLDEVNAYANMLSRISAHFEETIIVKSNHDEFLDRYIADGGYNRDPQNTSCGLRMHAEAIDGHDPLEWAVRRNFEKATNEVIRFLKRDEDFKIAGFECGAHGDKGANGARGSLQAMENAYGSSVSGHVHTPEILRKVISVGTCSKRKLRYNVGPSGWLNTSCTIYENGMFQLVTVIGGRYRPSA